MQEARLLLPDGQEIILTLDPDGRFNIYRGYKGYTDIMLAAGDLYSGEVIATINLDLTTTFEQ